MNGLGEGETTVTAPALAALVRKIRDCPSRAVPDGRLLGFLEPTDPGIGVPPAIRAFLLAWAHHGVDEIVVGDLWMADRFIDRSFWIPVYEQRGHGADADIRAVPDTYRSDLVVVGEEPAVSVGYGYSIRRTVALQGAAAGHDHVVVIGTPYTYGSGQTLDAYLAEQHRKAQKEGFRSDLARYLET